MRQNALKQYTLSLTKISIMISFIFTKLLKITGVSLSFDPTLSQVVGKSGVTFNAALLKKSNFLSQTLIF